MKTTFIWFVNFQLRFGNWFMAVSPQSNPPLDRGGTAFNGMPPAQPHGSKSPLSRLMLGVSLVLIAANLRPVFSSASALLPEIQTEFGLSTFGASILTTLPVICLGAFSPLAPLLSKRFGTERVLLGLLLLLALGTSLRGFSSIPLLFIGTALAGACIAIGNVLLPGIVKRDFADRAALLTGCYTMALCAGAAGGAGLTLPIERMLGQSIGGALAIWALPAVMVALLLLPQVVGSKARDRRSPIKVVGLWTDRVAWQVTLFMGLQSALAYCVFGWLVPILRDRGLDGVMAGAIVSFSVMTQAAACLVAPHIAVRGRDQRIINVTLCVLAVISLLGLLFAPLGMVWIWATLLGIAQGGLIAVALTDRAALSRPSRCGPSLRHGTVCRVLARRVRSPRGRRRPWLDRQLCLVRGPVRCSRRGRCRERLVRRPADPG